MNKKDLANLGIEDEELQQKIIVLHGKGIEKSKEDLEEAQGKLELLTGQLTEAGQTIESFKSMDIDAIKQSAEDYKIAATKAQEDAVKQVAAVKFDSALDKALAIAKAKNLKAVKALLEHDKLKLDEKGEALEGLEEQLTKVKSENDYLFESDEDLPEIITGGHNKEVLGDVVSEAARKGAGLSTAED